MRVSKETSSAHQQAADDLLRDEHATATGCFHAVQTLCGDEFRNWEPESIWLTLDRRGVEVSVLNRDKILAASTLTIIPAFWWEVNAYENTTLAFNNVVSNPDIVQEASPAQLSWAVYEAELLYSQQDDLTDPPEFDREPVQYTAIVLFRAGYLRAPDLLNFAQRELDRLNHNGAKVTVKQVDEAWKALQKKDLPDKSFSDSPLDIQLGHLASVELYLQEQLQRYRRDLDALHR